MRSSALARQETKRALDVVLAFNGAVAKVEFELILTRKYRHPERQIELDCYRQRVEARAEIRNRTGHAYFKALHERLMCQRELAFCALVLFRYVIGILQRVSGQHRHNPDVAVEFSRRPELTNPGKRCRRSRFAADAVPPDHGLRLADFFVRHVPHEAARE